MFLKIFLLIAGIRFVENHDLQVLTSNFFHNLQGDPHLLIEDSLSPSSKQFIETQISNYINLVTHEEAKTKKKKRSLLDKFTKNIEGTFLLRNVTPSATIPVKFPVDTALFQQNSQWFAAALESSDIKQNANYLVILKFEEQAFSEKARIPVTNGVKLATINLENSTLIAVAENENPKDNFHNKSGIFRFNESGLSKIQFIDMHYAQDIAMWQIHDEIYMSIAQFMSNQTGKIQFELEIPVYKWKGHFDLVQNIGTKGARTIRPFVVNHLNFLAVCNFRDNQGNTRIYSEIYKFDYHLEKYVLYQRILTKACTDIRVFSLAQNNQKDAFLIVANSQDKDSDGNTNYVTDSIIYKFVDNYFIPFQSFQINGIEQWLPIQGKTEFVLIASSRFNGLRYFQYDGWSFKETPQKTTDLIQTPGIKSIRSVYFNNSHTLIVSNKNNKGKTANIFRLEFSHQNTLNEIYSDMSTWCDSGLEKIQKMVEGEIFDEILRERADINEEQDNTQFEDLNSKIESLNSELDKINNVFEINADEIIFNNVTLIHNLDAEKINNFVTQELLNNTLNIDQGFNLGEVSLASMTDNSLNASIINRRDPKSLIHTFDNLNLINLDVNGTLSAPEGVRLEGRLNDVAINNLLLKTGDQNLSEPLIVNSAKIDRISVRALNNQNLTSLKQPEIVKIGHIETLKVKNLTIGGYINNIDVPTLDKYALKKSGNQRITSDYIFDEIQGKNLEVSGELSGKKLSQLIPTDSGNYSIESDVIFKNLVFVDNLQVREFLNEIEVIDNKLDILLRNTTEEQEITGAKIFDDVIVVPAINLQGRVKSKNLERINPLKTIEEDIVLTGPKTITGPVEIENFVKVTDIVTPDTSYSLSLLETDGLKLSSKEIKPHLHFVQQINVDEIFVDTINGKSPHDFVVVGTDEPQIIRSTKHFLGNVRITGATNALKINNVEIEELENQVLKIEEDQEIQGKHVVKHIIADKISSNVTKLNRNQILENVTRNGNFKVRQIKAGKLTVKGLVNDLKFNKIVNDTVRKNTEKFIGGQKFLKNLTIENLHVENGLSDNLEEITKLTFDKPLNLTNIKIKNIHFKNEFNGVNRADFGSDSDNATITENQIFDTVIVYGKVDIASKKINQEEVEDLVENTVKIDEPFEFNSVKFESRVISKNPVRLDGQIENFDFENAVLSNNDHELQVFDQKTFNNLTVNGSVTLDGFLNGINVTQFCKFSMGNTEDKNLTVDGNVFFAKGPKVRRLNNVSIKKIKNEAWFSDKNANLTGSVQFEDVIFENDIHVGGFVDNISLNLLYENYFSKSKDQNITAIFNFENELIFENNVSVPEISSNRGEINDLNLNEFVRTVLLNDFEQIFEIVVFLEDCQIENLTGEFLVNSLDLEKDVMRYDKMNIVTGKKHFENLNVTYLKLDKNIKIQNVDVLDWFKNSVLTTTSFNITGHKIFQNAIFLKGLETRNLNGRKFNTENIMMADIPQNITGRKTIIARKLNPVLYKAIKLRGLLNGSDVSEIINNQAYKNEENMFKTRLNLDNNITTNNLVIKKTYRGINMTELILNVTNLGVLNNLLEEYNKLLDMTQKLEKSAERQAYFIHHYKTVQIIPFITNSKIIFGSDNNFRIGSLVTDDDGFRMDLYSWHSHNQFSIDGIIKFNEDFTYIDQVFAGRYLYMERANGTASFTLMSAPVLHNTLTIRTNTTRSTTSFTLPYSGTNCTLFIYVDCAPIIFCEIEGSIEILQTLESSKALKASAITIEGTLYLGVITEPTDGLESQINLWRLNNQTGYFEIHQILFEAQPRSIATVSYNGFYYLAVASGHLQNAIFSGRLEIRKFDELNSQFVPWQSLELDAPIQVEFSVLPSNELVLYVVTDNPTEPLLVYRYEGIAGFKLTVTGSTLPKIFYINQFMGVANQHFIIAQSYGEINVIQAVFKGEKVADG